MDKSWMHADRRSKEFELGFEEFLKFAESNAVNIDKISCPCKKCCNVDGFSVEVVRDHVFYYGILESYKVWRWHGESMYDNGVESESESESESVNGDPGMGENDVEVGESEDEEMSEDSNEFLKFVEDGDQPLYNGCDHTTKMNFLVESFSWKAKHVVTDSCFGDFLELVKGLLPTENLVPLTTNDAKKTLSVLGMDYEKIHACPNDCILYRGDAVLVDAEECPSCGVSRWKLGRDNIPTKNVPAKVLWYFPPIPRFKRFYQSPKTAKNLTWHDWGRKKDKMMRHPADSPTWKLLDSKYPELGNDHRNLRLALSSDGFNPHSMQNSLYSCWPVILVTYNLPPWLCMKRKFMMLTLLISGPKQPGNDIDVYLQPLIDDLKLLWNGVEEVYDAFRGEYFKLKAVLFWTINDFPAYGNLSGSVVRGYHGCPICVDQTRPRRLKKGNKLVFMRHRRGLPRHHPYRRQAAAFDNTIEEDLAPVPLTGEEVLARVEGLNCEFGKREESTPRVRIVDDQDRPCWKKKSVFFQLEYWKDIPVRHNLDVMHIEKNCCDSLIGTLLNIPGKTKDGVAARLDMVAMGIRTELKPDVSGKRTKLPLASWNCKLDEKKIVCGSFFGMKVPTGFSSNIRNLVSMEDLKLSKLKSHDCHVVMQVLLPVALRSVLEKPVRYAIIRFCLFFKAICAKEIDVSKLEQMQADLVVTVCQLEKYFPPSFFDVMIHLTVHLVREVTLCGPVFFRWMYPFERYMKVFKGWVRSRRHPEGCIAESYVVEEAVEFCAEGLLNDDASTAGMPENSKPEVFHASNPLSAPTMISVYGKEMEQAHLCILQNTEDAKNYFSEHMELLKLLHPRFAKDEKWLKDKQNQTFSAWLKERVSNELQNSGNTVSETIRWMAAGPNNVVATFSGYKVNGVEFYTKQRDDMRTVQNSGVSLVADVMLVSSAKDKNPRHDDMDFYGVIQHIWEVDYYKFRVPLFKCDWVENVRGIKVDELGFTLVNLNRKGHLNDPFVLASHVKQIFYIEDPLDPQWSVVVRLPDRDYKGFDSDEEEGVHIEEQAFDLPFVETYDDIEGDQDSNYMRPGDEKIYVMAGSSTSSLNARALALRTKTKEFLRKRGRSEVANEEASVGKAATPRRSPRSTKVVVVDQTSKDAPTKADVVLPRRSPRSTARTSKDALNNARVGPAKATQSKKSVASKKLSFGSMSNSGSGKRKAGKSKAGKSKAGTMEVVESDDEDEEFEADEDEEESNENVTGGMRLLRRGMVTMSRVNRRLVRGRKLKVKYNDDGEPVGRAAKEMQSYIGVFARTKVPINVKDWRLVPLSVKDNIWGSIEEAYVVPKQWKKMVFASAGQKWRDFKSKLTTWYIIPFMDSPELFEFPPDDYRSIHADQWQEFVKDRISPQFQELRQKQMARRKENKYPHRLGRKPYAQLQEELAATVPAGRKLVRTTMWKAARQDKDGNYLAPQVQEKVDEIDKLEKEEQEGKRKFEGHVDVLTTALGTPEYSGRVRGVGGFVKPEAYFHLPKRARLNLDARQRIKNGEEDSSSVLAAERAQWKEEKAELVGRLVRLESLLMGKDKQIVESPKYATLINDLGSGQGSCSRLDKAGVGGNEVEGVKAIKKKLDLEEGKLKTQVEADEVTKEQAPEKPLTVEEEAHVMEMAQVQSSPTVQRHHLVIDSLDNIVAEGTIVEVGVDSSSQTVHGVPLAAENIRVSVSKCLVENALLPVPIRDEIVFVSDAIGTCVAWPKDWVIPATAVGNAKQAPRKYGRKKTKQWVDTDKDDDDLEHLPADLPPALLSLSKWGNEFLKDRATIHTKLSKDLFGTERKIALFRSDLFAFTNVQEVAGDTIVMYMSFLREKLKESNMLNMIGFVDPSSLGVGNSTDRSRSFSAALKRGKPGQFFLVPYNTGKHWILSVVSPSEELVYFMDPMKRRMDVTTDEWRTIVNQYGIPEQIGDKSCGYFIMLYMREIVQDKEQNWTKKWLTRGDEKYTMQDVDVVRQEWAEYVLKFTSN
ncbi:hypothetical protein ACLB2K_029426 [Fragaria x ananassa]